MMTKLRVRVLILKNKYVKRKEVLEITISAITHTVGKYLYEQEYNDVCQFIKELEEVLKDD